MQLQIIVIDKQRQYSSDVEQATIQHWIHLCQTKSNLFDGPCWSVIKIDRNNNNLVILTIQKTSYKYSLYTNYTNARNQLTFQQRANCYGVRSITRTNDGMILLGKRSPLAGVMPSTFDIIPAGMGDSSDPYETLQHEYLEELGIHIEKSDVHFIDIIDAGEEQGNKPEIVCYLHLQYSFDQIVNMASKASDRSEHSEIVGIHNLNHIEQYVPYTLLAKRSLERYFNIDFEK